MKRIVTSTLPPQKNIRHLYFQKGSFPSRNVCFFCFFRWTVVQCRDSQTKRTPENAPHIARLSVKLLSVSRFRAFQGNFFKSVFRVFIKGCRNERHDSCKTALRVYTRCGIDVVYTSVQTKKIFHLPPLLLQVLSFSPSPLPPLYDIPLLFIFSGRSERKSDCGVVCYRPLT